MTRSQSIEWGDILGPLLPPDRLQLTFEYEPDDVESRLVTLAPHGLRWTTGSDALATAIAGYEVG